MQSYARTLTVLGLLAIGPSFLWAQAQQKKPVNDELIAEVKPFFDSLAKACRAGSKVEIEKHFDVERLVDLLLATERIPNDVRKDPEVCKRTLAGLAVELPRLATAMRWETLTIKQATKTPQDHYLVTVRHDGAHRFRWWLARNQSTWKIIDFEDVEVGSRASEAMIAVVGEVLVDGQDVLRDLRLVAGVLRDLRLNRDPRLIDRKLEQLEKATLPKNYAALRHLAAALLRFERKQWNDGLQELEKASDLNNDIPRVQLLSAVSYARIGNWDRSAKLLQEFEDRFGGDATTNRLHGGVLLDQGRMSEAAVFFRKALDENPKDGEAFMSLVRSLEPGESRKDLIDRFAKLEDHAQQFEKLTDMFLGVRDVDSLRELATAMKRADPNYAPADLSLALSMIMSRQINEGLPLFKAALEKIDAGERERWIREFLSNMVIANRIVDAYAALPDSRQAFRFVASELSSRDRGEDLALLIKLHRQKNADDPSLPFYQASVHLMEGKYALAEKEFAKGMAGAPDPELLNRFRYARIQTYYFTGQVMRAYTEIEPRKETFRQLAAMCWSDMKYDDLQKLLDEHTKHDPNDLGLNEQRFRLKIKQGQTKDGIAIFKKAMSQQKDAFERRRMTEMFLLAMADADKALDGYLEAPDSLLAFQVVATNLRSMLKPAESDSILEAHRNRHADDPWLAVGSADKLMKEKSWEKAAQVFEGLWTKGPMELRDRTMRSYVFALYKSGRGLQAYQQLEPRDEVYEYLSSNYWVDKNGKDLEVLVNAHRANNGNDTQLQLDLMRAKMLQNQPDEAVRLYQALVKKKMDKFLTGNFVRDMIAAGHGDLAYKAAVDQNEAFRILAQTYVQMKQERLLDGLVTEHGRKHDGTLWHLYYHGHVHLLRGDYEPAARDFDAALAKARPRDDVWQLRDALDRAKIKAGMAADYYRQTGADREIFRALCFTCISENNAPQLDALIAARRKENADDAQLPLWELDALWLKKDYAGALKFIEKHRASVFDFPRNRRKVDAYQIRALVKVNRTDDAIKEAETLFKNNRISASLLVLPYAAAGNVTQTIAVVERYPRDRNLMEDCYRDQDLGAILRSEPFQEFRQRFPEPKKSPPSTDTDY